MTFRRGIIADEEMMGESVRDVRREEGRVNDNDQKSQLADLETGEEQDKEVEEDVEEG